MHTDRPADRAYIPDWAMMILINLASLTAVATLVLLSMAFDTFVFDLR